MQKPLTPKQEKFCQCVASGMTQADAYRDAFGQGKYTDKTLTERASRLSADSNVLARVEELRELSSSSAVMSITQRKEWITKLINAEKDVFNGDKIRALDILNKMDGAYAPKKLEVDANLSVRFVDILEKAMK